MTAQASETLIIAGNEFKLPTNLLPDCLTANNVHLDTEKDYSAVWELKDNNLYLNTFNGCINNKEANLNDLFLLPNSSPVPAYWITKKIEVEIGKINNLSNHIVIQIDIGFISNIYHKQAVRNRANNEILSEIEEEIVQERLLELLDIIPKMEWFNSGIFCYMAEGLDFEEITAKLIPIDLHYDELDAITIRLLNVMRKYDMDFMDFLSRFYPFTIETWRSYQECLSGGNGLFKNEFLDWSEELLIEFKKKWDDLDWSYQGIGMTLLKAEFKSYESFITFFGTKDRLQGNFIDKAFNMGFITEYDIHCCNAEMWLDKNSSTCLNPPKELEEVLAQIEKDGLDNVFNDGKYHQPVDALTSLFNCKNPLENGFDYTFNTPEKRKVLDDAVEIFLVEQSMKDRIEWSMCLIKRHRLVLSSESFNDDDWDMPF